MLLQCTAWADPTVARRLKQPGEGLGKASREALGWHLNRSLFDDGLWSGEQPGILQKRWMPGPNLKDSSEKHQVNRS